MREWAAELTRRREEVMVTLRDETVRVDDRDADRRAFERSTHAIDAYHRAFMAEVIESRESLELLIDFDRTHE